MSKDSEKVEHFRTTVLDRLNAELSDVLKHRDDIIREIQEYAALLVVVQNIESNKSGKINIRTSLGHQLFVDAELTRRDTIIVKLVGDLFAELKLARAEIFISEKLKILKKNADMCTEISSKIRATMKFIMAAISEYDELVAKSPI
ncbi:prefoldin subunit [Dictyocaulus viviparus]|uniref:Prefoldin subunit n=1 Tax=Dictyocaulus viviparus TaxID=29172 RepID=A0A0D8XZI2_DICVI|nr:prefoldin subunit [Dictyocaulus viviparus]